MEPAEDGLGNYEYGGATYTCTNSGSDTRYAQWQHNAVTMTYDPHIGSGAASDEPGNAASSVTV